MTDEFFNSNIDDENCCDQEEDTTMFSNDDCFQNQISSRDIVQLKNNIIPKGLVPLENFLTITMWKEIPRSLQMMKT
jgi:hypothetical protein